MRGTFHAARRAPRHAQALQTCFTAGRGQAPLRHVPLPLDVSTTLVT
jgi:hypothetical protein